MTLSATLAVVISGLWHQAGVGIGANVCFHAVMIVVALIRGTYFAVAFALPIFGRGEGGNQGRIDNGPFAQQQALFGESGFGVVE
jgi:hypothetical protein